MRYPRFFAYTHAISQAITFDTHRFIKRLVEAGISEKTAEALADEHINLLNGNLATKENLASIEANLEVKTAEIESRLLKWIIALMIGQTTLTISIIQLF